MQGLSTERKQLTDPAQASTEMPAGSTWYELDTQKTYIYSADNNQWYPFSEPVEAVQRLDGIDLKLSEFIDFLKLRLG